jgi:hypothetical protein
MIRGKAFKSGELPGSPLLVQKNNRLFSEYFKKALLKKEAKKGY